MGIVHVSCDYINFTMRLVLHIENTWSTWRSRSDIRTQGMTKLRLLKRSVEIKISKNAVSPT